jgi:hypothetical protein
MGSFVYRLELEDGASADPPVLRTAVPTWRPGDTIPFGGKTLRVIAVRDDDADQAPALVVEDMSAGHCIQFHGSLGCPRSIL